jgi:hypothetical protein
LVHRDEGFLAFARLLLIQVESVSLIFFRTQYGIYLQQSHGFEVMETLIAQRPGQSNSAYNRGSSRNLDERCATGGAAIMAPMLLWLCTDKLNRQNNWDVALTVGVRQQVNPVAQSAQPYGQVSVSYNLASRAINRHLDRAVEAHDEWKKVEEGDVVRQMEVLRQQLVDCVMVQEANPSSSLSGSKQG